MLKNADNVKQKTTTTGTGSYVFSSDVTGYFRFDDAANGVGVNNSCIYAVRMGANFEVAKGTVAADGLSITRDEVIESSNGGSLVNWSAGEKDIYVTLSAKRPYLESLNHGPLGGFRNRLKNGGFRYKNVGLATTPDGCYGIDGWYALTQANPIAIARQSAPEAGATHGVRLTQSNASAQRIGLAQVISNERMADMAGKPCTLSGRVRTSAGNIMNFAVIEWTGTADAVTLDVVNDWTNGTFTTGNFFKATNFNAPIRGGFSTVANTWQSFSLNYTPSSSATNLIVLAWSNGALAQNATVDFNRMQFELGEAATVFERRVERLRKPILIPITGQSNAVQMPSYTWTPPENLKGTWNNTVGGVDTGTAMIPVDTTKMGLGYAAAAHLAERFPNNDIFVVNVGYDGMPIAQWMTGASAPDVYAALKANIEAALAVLGLSKLSLEAAMIWWQFESDAVAGSTTYEANFDSVETRLLAESWWPAGMRIVVMGGSILYSSDVTNFHKYLVRLAAAAPDRRIYCHTGILPSALWDPAGTNIHMLGAGYWEAGGLAINALFGGARRAAIQNMSVDPITGNVIFGASAATARPWEFQKAQNAATAVRVSNVNSGAAASATFQVESNAGLLDINALSSAYSILPGSAGINWTGSGGLIYNAAHASGKHDFYTNNTGRWSISALGHFLPLVDVTYDIGSTAARARAVYSEKLFIGGGTISISSGAGSPEGVVTAPVGSLYTRTDGGASTTLYVKTSGTGNTGWTAK